MKKALSFLLVFAMIWSLLAALPLSVGAVETLQSGYYEYYIQEDGTAAITKYTGTASSVTIPSSLDGHTVTYVSGFVGNHTLTNVTIPNTVTVIGTSAFAANTSLTSVEIPNSVTVIGESAFYNNASLASVKIPNSVTVISRCAFEKCTALKNVTVPSSVTSIGDYAFSDCSSLESITILSPNAEIGDQAFGEGHVLSTGGSSSIWVDHYYTIELTVYGFTGSTADEYVQQGYYYDEDHINRMTFISIDDRRVASAACTVTAPVAGEKPDYSAVPADSTAYTAKVASWHTGSGRSERTLTADETFAQGAVYRAYVRFTANDEYIFADDAAYTINGMTATKTTIRGVDYYVVSFTAGAAPVSYIIGDADTDGEVTILDATAIQRKLANLSTEAYDANAADADEDAEVTILDATAIQRHLASLDTNPNIGKPKA